MRYRSRALRCRVPGYYGLGVDEGLGGGRVPPRTGLWAFIDGAGNPEVARAGAYSASFDAIRTNTLLIGD